MRKNKGFTLIELMIVIAIIAIIAAIAIPNLLQSRIRANESNAVAQIRNYVAAQSVFQERDCGWILANLGGSADAAAAITANRNAYANNYCNLYYGNPIIGNAGAPVADATASLRLISKAHADAYARAPIGTIGAPEVQPGTAVVFNGYFWTEPAGTDEAFYSTRYAQVAVPADSDRTGSRAFYMDDNGAIAFFLLARAQLVAATAPMATPVTVAGAAGWTY